MEKPELFDEWPEKYDEWFTTPIGLLVKKHESELLIHLSRPKSDEFMLDAGCGTGVFTLEFIEDAKRAMQELFRVTKKGGRIVVATLNSFSPWAERRKAEAKTGHPLFKKASFRSPDELLALAPVKGVARTAIHFQKEDDPARAHEIEKEGQRRGLKTGAFLAR